MIRNIRFLYIKRELGWSGAAGGLIAFVALSVYGLGILPTQANITSNVLSIKQTQKTELKLKPNIEDSSEVSNSSAISPMPSIHGLPKELSALLRLVEQQNLELIAGEYKLGQSLNEDFIQYEMMLPLKGSYQDIRYFVDSLSIELPYVGIKSLDLKRASINEPEIEARLNIVFHLHHRKKGVT